MLVLDDLHWADQPSLMLLQFVARELGNSRLLLVGTYRDMELSRQHPLAEALGELTRERLFQRVLLRGLSQQDVARFIEVAAGVDPPSGLAEAVHTQTEGNPLFVTEVVRLLVQEGELTQETGPRDSWTVRIPEGVREVIGRRLNRLSQRCNETLTIASVIGREFELRQLTPLVEDISEDRLLEVLEEALSALVIEELPQAVGRYQFTHALIQETLTEELTLTRRVRLHARIAETLEALYGEQAETHAGELAHHFAEAEAVLGTEKLAHYSLLAGERALGAYAYEEALANFERGLAARRIPLNGAEAAPDAEAALLLFGLGQAQVGIMSMAGAREVVANLEIAFDYFAQAGNAPQAVAVAGITAPGPATALMLPMRIRALELAAPGSTEAGRLLSGIGRTLGRNKGDYVAAQESFNQALDIARRLGDVDLEMEVLSQAANVDAFYMKADQSLEKALRVIELSPKGDSPYALAVALLWAGNNLMLFNGDPAAATTYVEDLLTLAQSRRDRYLIATACWIKGDLMHLTGIWKLREISSSALWPQTGTTPGRSVWRPTWLMKLEILNGAAILSKPCWKSCAGGSQILLRCILRQRL